MNSRTTLAVLGLISTTGASGCYSTWDLTPRGVLQLNGFRSGNYIDVETTENERIPFTKDTKLSFYGSDQAVAEEVTFSKIELRRNVLIGEDAESGQKLLVDLSRMNTVQATNFSVGKTALLATGVTIPTLIMGYVFLAAISIGGGRPLRVPGRTEAVRAPLLRARHRVHTRAPIADEMTRRKIFEHWANEASAECASIPAFLALARDLKKVGAPRSLVEAALQAAREEATHTKLCLALTNMQTDHAILTQTPDIPTSNDIDNEALLQRLTLEAFWDGCLAEGSAAIVARRSAAHTRDEATRLALQTITRDEANHAELAQLIVAYGLSAGGPSLRRVLHESFEARRADEEAQLDRATAIDADEPLVDKKFAREHGVPDEHLMRESRIEAWEKNVLSLARV